MTVALIDGDVVAYMAAFAAQRNVYFIDVFRDGEAIEEYEFLIKEEALELKEYLEGKAVYLDCNLILRKEVKAASPKHAEICARQIIMKILGDTKATNYKLYLTAPDKSNFRYKIAKTKPYKGNRKAEKPIHYSHVRDYLHKVWEGYVVVGEEADDYIGIEQCKNLIHDSDGNIIDSKTITSTIDKDILNQIPGMHHNIKTGEIHLTTEEDAMRFFWKQMLMGDSVDDIPGVPRVGKVTANRLIDNCESLEECREIVQSAYKKYYKGVWKEQYTEMGNLLWIKREPHAIFEDLAISFGGDIDE